MDVHINVSETIANLPWIGWGGGAASDGEDIWISEDGEGHKYSDVLYHEYTHNVLDHIYAQDLHESGLMGRSLAEGLCDYFAATLNGDPYIGEGYISPPRSLSNNLKYPADYGNDPHKNGRILGGALWDLRSSLGASTTDALVFNTLFVTPRARTFQQFLDNMLLADDNDGNLENDTPHDTQIIDAFANHGIAPSDIYVPGYYSTIQEGINAAARYGYPVTVMVSPGTYNEQISMKEDVDVWAIDYSNPSNTVIDVGTDYTTAVSFSGIANARLRGFTLRGYAAVSCVNSSSPASLGNVIWDCIIHDSEYGVHCDNSSPRLKGTTITNCSYGLMLYNSSNPILREPWGLNTIEGSGEGVRCITGSVPELGVYSPGEWGKNNILTSGYDIYISPSNPENLTIYAQKNWWGEGEVPSIYYGEPSWEVIWEPALDGPAGKLAASKGMAPWLDQYRRASLLLSKGEYSEAIAGFKGVIEEYPSSKAAQASLVGLIFAYREMGAEGECLAYLEETAQRYSDLPLGGAALRASVSVLRRLGLGEKALKRVSELLEKFKGTKWERDLLFAKGMIYKHNLKAYEKAKAVFEEFVRRYPDDIVADFAKLELGYDPIRTAREKPGEQRISEVCLFQSNPNPFNAQTAISFALPRPAFVRLEVYNTLGHRVRTVVEGRMKAGRYSIIWDGRDGKGGHVPSGVYVIRLEAGGKAFARKVVLVR